MVSAQSAECPICGRSHKVMACRAVVKWVLVVGASVWAVGHFGLRAGGAGSDAQAGPAAAQVRAGQ